MNAIIRSLIVWLVLLAVPFQGFAAAAALPCAPSGAMHDHAAMVHQGHHVADAAGAVHHDGPGHHAGTKCGSCAACWAGAAMAPAIAVPGMPQPASVTIPFDAGPVPTFHPSLPERPPRSARA